MEIKYICSLGNSCHTAYILKRNKLKLESYPFDWIISNCKMVKHCIEDNFHIFLDKNYYVSTQDGRKCRHTYYKEDVFYHHNPLKNEEFYEYYIRCVQRFQDFLKKPEPKLFMMMITNITDTDVDKKLQDMKEETISLRNTFSKYTDNYTLLVIFHFPNKDVNYNNFSDSEDTNNKDTNMNNDINTYNNIHFLEIHTKSKSNGIAFECLDDNIYLRNILRSKYKFVL